MDSMLRVAAGDNTWSPDSGQRPPLAKEAAMAAPDSQVTSVEEHCRTSETLLNMWLNLLLLSLSMDLTCSTRSRAALMSTFSGKHCEEEFG